MKCVLCDGMHDAESCPQRHQMRALRNIAEQLERIADNMEGKRL